MEKFKNSQVILLPTNQITKLAIVYDNLKDDGKSTRLEQSMMQQPHVNKGMGMFITGFKKPIYHHIYVISDDEIKEGDHIYSTINKNINTCNNPSIAKGLKYKKIIATTDNSLGIITIAKYGVDDLITYLPQPSQQFIEKYIEFYNKGKIITDVLVKLKNNYDLDYYTPPGGIECCRKIDNWELDITEDNTIIIQQLRDNFSRKEIEELFHKFGSQATTKQISFEHIPSHFVADSLEIKKFLKENL